MLRVTRRQASFRIYHHPPSGKVPSGSRRATADHTRRCQRLWCTNFLAYLDSQCPCQQARAHPHGTRVPSCMPRAVCLPPPLLPRPQPPPLIIGGAFASDVSLALFDWTNLGILSHLTFPQPDRLKRTPVQFTPLKVGPKKPTLPVKNLRVAEGWGSKRAQCARAAPLSVRRSKEIFCKPSRLIKKIF